MIGADREIIRSGTTAGQCTNHGRAWLGDVCGSGLERLKRLLAALTPIDAHQNEKPSSETNSTDNRGKCEPALGGAGGLGRSGWRWRRRCRTTRRPRGRRRPGLGETTERENC